MNGADTQSSVKFGIVNERRRALQKDSVHPI